MAYSLQAFICDLTAAKQKQLPKIGIVVLAQSRVLIPITNTVRQTYEIPSMPLIVDQTIPAELGKLVGILNEPQLVYIEAEFFGGAGDQAAVVWNNEKIILGPLIEANAINNALRAIGVKLGNFKDEFEALGLGKHRHEEDWLNSQPQ